jgi:predicted RNA-binding Zn-ribbon protein involved in translation (DUF1610 family)
MSAGSIKAICKEVGVYIVKSEQQTMFSCPDKGFVVIFVLLPTYKDRLHGQTRTGNPSKTPTRAGKKGKAQRQGGKKGPEKSAENKQCGLTGLPGLARISHQAAMNHR